MARDADLPAMRRIVVDAFGHSTIHCLLEDRFGMIGGRSWEEHKANEIEGFYRAHPNQVLVTEIENRIVGFATYSLDEKRKVGIVGNNAVDPKYQSRGIGTEQIREVLARMTAKGMRIAEVKTGTSEAFAPARRMYETLGFSPTTESVLYHLSLD